MPNSGNPGKAGVCEIECQGKTHPANTPPPAGKNWGTCDYKQFCAKVAEVEKQAKGEPDAVLSGPFERQTVFKKLRREGNGAAGDFRDEWNAGVGSMGEDQKKAGFYDDCAYLESKNGADVSGFSPDHVHELQHGGSVLGPFKWCRSYVNESLGGHMRGFKPGEHTSIEADCCPA